MRNQKMTKWQRRANRLWRWNAAWISEDGRYALVQPCKALTVILFEDENDALEHLPQVCSDSCSPHRHVVRDLAKTDAMLLIECRVLDGTTVEEVLCKPNTKEVAKELGVAVATVKKWRGDLGVEQVEQN